MQTKYCLRKPCIWYLLSEVLTIRKMWFCNPLGICLWLHVRPVDPDQPAHPRCLFRIYTLHFYRSIVLLWPRSKQCYSRFWLDGMVDMDLNWSPIICYLCSLLNTFHLYCEGEQFRSRSAGTSVPSDQDLKCSLFYSLGYFWPKCD
jgi:hypothetical protein